ASHMALHTAALLLVLGVGAMAAQPDVGLMALLLSDGPGGSTLRRLLPAAFGVPFAIGWLRLHGQRMGLYGTEFGTAIFVVTTILVLSAVILKTAASLARMDRAQWRTEEASR